MYIGPQSTVHSPQDPGPRRRGGSVRRRRITARARSHANPVTLALVSRSLAASYDAYQQHQVKDQ